MEPLAQRGPAATNERLANRKKLTPWLKEESQRPLPKRNTIKCTFKDCYQRFKTHDEMLEHKRDDENHFFCETCPAKNEAGEALYDEEGEP